MNSSLPIIKKKKKKSSPQLSSLDLGSHFSWNPEIVDLPSPEPTSTISTNLSKKLHLFSQPTLIVQSVSDKMEKENQPLGYGVMVATAGGTIEVATAGSSDGSDRRHEQWWQASTSILWVSQRLWRRTRK